MNTTANTIRLGIRRGWIEFNILILRNVQGLVWAVAIAAIFLTVIWFQRDTELNGVSLALMTLPSLLGMQIANEGFSGVASILSYDREDGTLLRAKAVPQGMTAYLIARIVMTMLSALLNLSIIFIPGMFIIGGLAGIGFDGLAAFLGIMLLGLLATAPIGAAIGAIVKSSGAGFGFTFLPMILIVSISGIFYPITALAGWLQVIGQAFPVYWLGLGLRSIFLPDAAKALELGGSWRTAEMLIVLGAWIVIGFVLAPRILRRMAKRVTGSDMEAGRQRTIQRGY